MKPPRLEILRATTYRAMPWRNGNGMTLEIARDPATGESFRWRLSLADIAQDGPFSAYPGYRRALVLVHGEDLRLAFGEHGQRRLSPARRGALFEGDWSTQCSVPLGRCTDLSLIVRKGAAGSPACIVRAPSILSLVSTRELMLSAPLYSALFVLEGTAEVGEVGDPRTELAHPRDTLIIRPGADRTLRLKNRGSGTARLALLRWRPGHP
ncbi:MAG: HutD/Ves family protein [Steroidobacteraceae bacterium]